MTSRDPKPGDRFASDIDFLIESVLDSPGELSRDQRTALFERAAAAAGTGTDQGTAGFVDAPLEKLIDKLIHHAYKVTQTDIDNVLENGHSQDAVFETVVSVATGAGIGRLRRGLAALEEAVGKFHDEKEKWDDVSQEG